MKNNDFKTIEFKGKKLRINKFNPLDGCYILQRVLCTIMPDIFEEQIKENRPFDPQKSLTREESNELILTCCRCAVYLKDNVILEDIPIINDNDSFAIQAFDFSDYFLIAMEVLAFNLLGFFTAENLKQLLGIFKKTQVLIMGAQIAKAGANLG